MSFLAPLFFAGLAAIAVPIVVHLIQRERKEVIHFPSLMFLQRIPYQSVERRRIHNWLLLALRAGAMALVVLAFSRPFLKQDPVKAAAATTGAREVILLLDRSASMVYGITRRRDRLEARPFAITSRAPRRKPRRSSARSAATTAGRSCSSRVTPSRPSGRRPITAGSPPRSTRPR